MLRRIALVVVLLATTALAAPRTASAHVDACAGDWAMYTGTSLSPPPGRASETWFSSYLVNGACASFALPAMSGTVAGFFGFATGSGTAYVSGDALSFEFVWVGGTIQIFGQLRGTWTVYPCLSSWCNYWLTGALEVVHA